MRANTAREREQADRYVGDTLVKVVPALRLDRIRQLVEKPENHRDVVRRERPEDVLLSPDLPEIETVGVNVPDAAELTPVDELLES